MNLGTYVCRIGDRFPAKTSCFAHSQAQQISRTEPGNSGAFPNSRSNVYNPIARNDGGDRLRQEPERSSRCMPGYLMQLVKKRRENTIANTELALAA